MAALSDPAVLINEKVFLYRDKAPFVPSGRSVLGAIEYDKDNDMIRCHECGDWFKSVGAHAVKAHGIGSREYKRRHGLRKRTPLIAVGVKEKMCRRSRKRRRSVCQASTKSRFRTGHVPAPQAKIQHELRNERGSCSAQTTESIIRLARHLGRTPTRNELREYGIGIQSAEHLFGMKMRNILGTLGLKDRKPGKNTKIDERMEWPADYFTVSADRLQRGSSLG